MREILATHVESTHTGQTMTTAPADGQLTAISLFSGCGGLDVGAARAGVDVVWANDSMPETADAIATLIPGAEFELGDIRRVRAFPKADLVLGGYPCQPFSMGGARNPANDRRAELFREFARAVAIVEPRYFVAENVVGLRSLFAQRWLDEQAALFSGLGRHGYHVSVDVLDAADFGVPQRRRRVFLVGVRKDERRVYRYPETTHCRPGLDPDKKPWASHGDALAAANLPDWPAGEFYDRPGDPDEGFSWWYMSRNRKAPWDAPAKTVLANERHVALHPASPTMHLVWSRLADGTKQGWEFSGEYEHLDGHPDRLLLDRPRRLSWRECAILQTFPTGFEPSGSSNRKYEQIGNAVPPALAEAVIRGLVDGSGLTRVANLTDDERRAFGLPTRGRRRTEP
jgi:DNA (cytosine-5)-methyltransferase 1